MAEDQQSLQLAYCFAISCRKPCRKLENVGNHEEMTRLQQMPLIPVNGKTLITILGCTLDSANSSQPVLKIWFLLWTVEIHWIIAEPELLSSISGGISLLLQILNVYVLLPKIFERYSLVKFLAMFSIIAWLSTAYNAFTKILSKSKNSWIKVLYQREGFGQGNWMLLSKDNVDKKLPLKLDTLVMGIVK